MTNVSRIVALVGSMCRILRGLEAPGGPDSNQPNRLGGSAKQKNWGREPGGSEVGSLDIWILGARKLEVWMFGCLESFEV